MNIRNVMIASVAALLATWACSTQAGLLGSEVNLSVYYPNMTTLLGSPGATVTVSGAIEYPVGSGPQMPGASIDITDTQFIVHWTESYNQGLATSPFNGYLLTILSGPSIVSATADAASNFKPVGISIENGDQLWLNYSGQTFTANGESIIDITTSRVPDGGLTIATLGMAILGLGFIRRKL